MKVLIISHNPLCTYNNMGRSMLALFDRFKPEELCQLYIHISVPDTDKCRSYYRITDKDVLDSYYRFKVRGGEIAPDFGNHTMFASAQDEKLYRNPKNKRPFRMLARDAMWKLSRWYNADLKNWLDREKPDMIFTAPGSAKFIYDIALKISRELNIPIVAYICDDYYFVKKADSVLGRIQQKLLRRRIDQLFAHTSHIITICDELNELYSAKFGVPAATVMTGSNYPISRDVKVCGNPTTITYFGNIRCDRYVSLAEIGRALDSINSERGTDYILNIYSGEKDSEILSHFDGIRAICFRGFVGGEEFDEAFRSSEILLHTEAFDEDSVDLVKHSVSTKIADSLASGIPMFAYGPAEVSSMKHLLRNECAVTATSQAELKTKLEELFDDAALRREAAENGIAAAERLHNTPVSSARVYEIIESVQRAKP